MFERRNMPKSDLKEFQSTSHWIKEGNILNFIIPGDPDWFNDEELIAPKKWNELQFYRNELILILSKKHIVSQVNTYKTI